MQDSELKKHLDPSLYRILCIERNATDELIKKTWKGMLVNFHPDKNKGNEDFATEKTKELNFAYKVLSNSELRARYDVFYDKHLADEAAKKKEKQLEKIRKELKLVKEKLSPKAKSYLIGYDLKTPGDYPELIETIKHFANWWHHLDSTWIVKSSLDIEEIRNKLEAHIGKKDELLVVSLTGEGAWAGFSEKGSDWLLKNL